MFIYDVSLLRKSIDDKTIQISVPSGLPLGTRLYKTIYVSYTFQHFRKAKRKATNWLTRMKKDESGDRKDAINSLLFLAM